MILDNYQRVCASIEEGAIAAGRDPSSVRLVVASKGHPWSDSVPLYQAGCREFGESRVQEALSKQGEAPESVHWHFFGHLQRNKVRHVVGRFALLHSIDSLELAKKISEVSQEKDLQTKILLEINASGEKNKYGLSAEDYLKQLEHFFDLPGIKICGLMTMAPFIQDEKIVRSCFAKLRTLLEHGQERIKSSGFCELSMGMSNDYRWAIREGATWLRIGTAIY